MHVFSAVERSRVLRTNEGWAALRHTMRRVLAQRPHLWRRVSTVYNAGAAHLKRGIAPGQRVVAELRFEPVLQGSLVKCGLPSAHVAAVEARCRLERSSVASPVDA